MPIIIGHRGAAWDAPENTLASLRIAWEQGADAVEFDVHMSKDGTIVLLHDRNLQRTAGVNALVTDLTAEELGRIDAGRWKSEAFSGVTVPTLEQALATLPTDRAARAFIEVKCGPEILPALGRTLASVISTTGLTKNQFEIIGFSEEVIAACKTQIPEYSACLLVDLTKANGTVAEWIAKARAIGADGLDISADLDTFTEESVRAIRASGLKWYVWTVNDPAAAAHWAGLGVHGITTDRPGWLRERLVHPEDVHVMSFNIRYGTAASDVGENRWESRKGLLALTIQGYGPDVLGTQETLADQRDFLVGELPGYAVWGVGRDDGRLAGEMCALFYRTTRFHFCAGGHFFLSEHPEVIGGKGWDASLPRLASWVLLRDRMTPAGTPILVLNTHLDHRGKVARRESAKLLRAKIRELERDAGTPLRVILTGDFNSDVGDAAYTALFGPDGDSKTPSPLADTFRVIHPNALPDEGTFGEFSPGPVNGGRIDWIAASRNWIIVSAGIDRTARHGRTASDHYAVTATLRPHS